MQDWVFDIVAVVVCCLGFVLLFSLMRILITLLKLAIVVGIIIFVGRAYSPTFSLADFPTRRTFEMLSDGTRYVTALGQEFLKEAWKLVPAESPAAPLRGNTSGGKAVNARVLKTSARKAGGA